MHLMFLTRFPLAVFLAAGLTLTLGACSSSDDGGDDAAMGGPDTSTGDNSTPGTDGNGGTTPPPAQNDDPPAGMRAGAYVGTLAGGSGVAVLDNDNELVALTTLDDGSARSFFGNVGSAAQFGGTLREHVHVASTPPDAGVFSAGELVESPTAISLTIADGESLVSDDGRFSLNTASGGGLVPATADALAGSWSGEHQFGGDSGPIQLITELTFGLGGDFTGETRLAGAPDEFRNPIAGTFDEFGEVSRVSYTWNGNDYRGVVYFVPDGSGRIVLIGETDNEAAGNRTIASLLSR